jgi:alkanesulfonate monooxygenase SsuD/methylene tetrahydromethanopterin reductase-like flavin-dependent oxidoreductase (luciferase family)
MTYTGDRPRDALLFGVNVPTNATSDRDPVAAALRAEELGFDFVSSSDHPCGTDPTYETWTMLSYIAAATSHIGVATRVLGVPYRPPPMVAKMAETLDRLSGGRLILGLGGGSGDDEHRAFGLGVRSPKDKTDGLEEAVTIIRGLWSASRFTFAGRVYHTAAATLEPKPNRKIPIWLGTFAPRALTVTGRLADGWIPSLGYASPDALVEMRERVLEAAVAAGREADEITCILNVELRIDPNATAKDDVVAGPVSAVVERLADFVRAGFSGFNFMPIGTDSEQQLERLANEVIPSLRRSSTERVTPRGR